MDSTTILKCLYDRTQSAENIRTLHEWFKGKAEIFKDLTLETMKDILDTAKIIEKYPNELIIRQGDVGDCFYVLLSGSASVYINTDLNMILLDEQSERNSVNTQSKQVSITKGTKTQQKKMGMKKFAADSDRKIYGESTYRYGEGDYFGEMALIQPENIRNASIVADEKCHLLAISRDLFDKAIRSPTESIYQDKISLINGHYLFQKRTAKFKHHIAMSLVKVNIYFGQDIVTQGQPSIGLFIFRSGEAKIVIDTKLHQRQHESYISTIGPVDHKPQDQMTSARGSNRTPRKESTDHFKREKIEVAIVGKNDIIGDIEFGFSLPTYLMTATALESCEVYLLKTVHLERMLNFKRNISTYGMLQDLAKLKLKTYYERCLAFAELPLLKLLSSEGTVEAEMESLTEEISKEGQKISLLPIFKTGPIIDFYGPGSVFFRNRLKRQVTSRKLNKVKERSVLSNSTNKTKSIQSFDDQYEDLVVTDTVKEPKKSIFQIHKKSSGFFDWETSSLHLNDLEHRMNTLIEGCTRSRTDLSIDSAILKLQRFRYQELPNQCKFIVKYKRSPNDNVNDTEKRSTGGKEENIESGMKLQDSLVRQYTEVEYLKLKEEMRVKEKRLSIFRMKYSI